MIFRPAGRFFTGPRPPVALAARVLAAVIRPPLLFFAISIFLFWFVLVDEWISIEFHMPYGAGMVMVFASIVTAPIRASALPSRVAPVPSEMD